MKLLYRFIHASSLFLCTWGPLGAPEGSDHIAAYSHGRMVAGLSCSVIF